MGETRRRRRQSLKSDLLLADIVKNTDMVSIYDVKIPDLVPAGEKGVARVDHFCVSRRESRSTAIRAMQDPFSLVPEGKYASLYVKHILTMSDTDMERRTNMEFVHRAHGRVLVAGLGLGLILFPLADKPEVEHIVVVEKHQDVIDLVEPSLRTRLGNRLEVVCADIFGWRPPKGTKFDIIYFDIWTDICIDNLKGIAKLHQKFGRYLSQDGQAWISSWMKEELKAMRRRERR